MTKNNMLRLLVFVMISATAIVLAACAPVQAADLNQQATAVPGVTETTALPRQVTVVGYGEVFGEPDQAQVQIGVETFSPTVNEATTDNETTLSTVMEALSGAGIPKKDIQTSNYSVWAEQIYGDRGPEGIAGYHVSNMVTVTIRDIGLVDDVLGAVTQAGANSIYGVNFTVADSAALEAEARAEAVADAQQRAESLAELAGVELGEPILISEVVNQSSPMPLGFGNGNAMVEQANAAGISPDNSAISCRFRLRMRLSNK
ncbi:MAG: SIMPL domain-containing protein [Chloroflexota bacterium]